MKLSLVTFLPFALIGASVMMAAETGFDVESDVVRSNEEKKISRAKKEAISYSEISLYYGNGTRIAAFQNQNIIGSDKGDLVKTENQQIRAEFILSDFMTINSDFFTTDYSLNVGFNLTADLDGGNQTKIMPVIPGYNTKYKEVSVDPKDYVWFGTFFGANYGSWQFDFGFDLRFSAGSDGAQEMRETSPGVYEAVNLNRGETLNVTAMNTNFLLRIGNKESLNLTFSFLRGMYNTRMDPLQLYFTLPVVKWFKAQVGVGLAQYTTMFLGTQFKIFENYILHLKASMITKYRDADLSDSALKVVFLNDAFIYSAGLSARF